MPLQKLSEAARGQTRRAELPSRNAALAGGILLPSERAAETLQAFSETRSEEVRRGQLWRQPMQQAHSTAASDAPGGASSSNVGGTSKIYRWNEFGKEITTEFDDSHFHLEGHFESNSSAGHKEFQDRLRAIHFRREGRTRSDIAQILGRSEKFVTKWWQKEEKEVPRPWGVHEYLSKEMGSRTFNGQAGMSTGSESSTAAWWRDIEIRRKFFVDPGIYEELLSSTDWNAGVARTRDFTTGASHLKYDKEGKLKPQSNLGAKYRQGQSPKMDQCLQKLFAEFGIADRTSGITLNWYPDGHGTLGSHRHDCWTALFSFGHERILTIDKTPLLCQDGDLVIFGTQRHGVPHMPEVTEGRITVPVFFYPDHLQLQKQWQTLTDPEDPRASRQLQKLTREHTLGSTAIEESIWSAEERQEMVLQLVQAGFEEESAKDALIAHGFDVEAAAETLLLAGCCSEFADLSSNSVPLRGGRWGLSMTSPEPVVEVIESAQVVEELPEIDVLPEPCAHRNAAENLDATTSDELDADVALAMQMEMESLGAEDQGIQDISAALAAQLEEDDLNQGAGICSELLEVQFQEYEDQMKRDDAQKWHGHGDLMQSGFAREVLSLDNMDKVTVYSIGHGRLPEKSFFEILSLHSVRTLYDFRSSDYRGDVYTPCAHFSVRSLKSTCKSRGISYKHIALGRESAYGILSHINSDEAKHALIELVWHGKRGHTAFLGREDSWQLDPRQVIAEELQKHGHHVKHIDITGATEDHVSGHKFPDFILQEEERLRKLEKMRQAGELKRPDKSAVDRSSESIASRLARPAEEVDAMDELRAAGNQVELVQVQRKLARVQRIAEKKGLLANKALTNTPQWILDEAREQEAWIAQKKMEKAAQADKAEKANRASKTEDSEVDEETAAETLMVECTTCSVVLPWCILRKGDGACPDCHGVHTAEVMKAGLADSKFAVPVAALANAAIVTNAELMEPGGSTSESSSSTVARSSWRSRRRAAAAAAAV